MATLTNSVHVTRARPRPPMKSILVLLFLLVTLPRLLEAFSLSNNKNEKKIHFRNGKTSDELTIATTMVQELMNPLGIQGERFVMATILQDNHDKDTPIGWAQIRPLGSSTTTAQRDPSIYDARPGSFDVERDADDAMWDEFEEEVDTVVPVGLASLPWTKEYRSFAKAAERRRERRAEIIEERRREATSHQLYELASVYVRPDYRGEGIGTELIQRVLQKHVDAGRSMSDVYLLTLATTAGWYCNSFGSFDVVSEDQVPAPMAFEMAAGTVLTKLIGANLCCMRGGGLSK